MKPAEMRAIVVSTDSKGVYFGYIPETMTDVEAATAPALTLKRGRMAVYWSRDMKGSTGLATLGPSQSCRIGYPATITVTGVHRVDRVDNPEVIERWEAQPWG